MILQDPDATYALVLEHQSLPVASEQVEPSECRGFWPLESLFQAVAVTPGHLWAE